MDIRRAARIVSIAWMLEFVLCLVPRTSPALGIPSDVADASRAAMVRDDEASQRLLPHRTGTPRHIRRGAVTGGVADQGPTASSLSYSTAAWVELPPPVRYGAIAVYDSAADRLVIGGGSVGILSSSDAWALDLAMPSKWQRWPIGGETPTPVGRAATAVDAVHRRMFLVDQVRDPRISDWIGDVHILDLTAAPAWTRIRPPSTSHSPFIRSSASLVYDTRRDRLVLYGGWGARGPLGDVWSFDLKTGLWSEIVAGGDSIAPRAESMAVYDPERDRMLVYGGVVESAPHIVDLTDEMWALEFGDSTAWHRVIATGDSVGARAGAQLVRDPTDGSMLLFGGVGTTVSPTSGEVFRFVSNPMPTWTRIVPGGVVPRSRVLSSVAYDSRRSRFLLFGGSGTPIDRLDVDAFTPMPSPAWSALSSDSLPPGRFGHAMVHDFRRDRLLIFGGVSARGYLGDTWAAPLEHPEEWTRVVISGPSPPPRHEPVATYDPVRDRLVAFGGWTYPENYFNDTWVLSFDGDPSWSRAEPEGEWPSARRAHVAVYDPLRDRMLVFSGFGPSGELDDVWALYLDGAMRWERVQPTGPDPGSRGFASAVYDPTRDRVVLYGGVRGGHSLDDAWALSLADSRWEHLTTGSWSPALTRHTAVYDLDQDRMVVFGGWDIDDDVLVSEEGVTFGLEFGPEPRWSADLYRTFAPTRIGHTAFYDPGRSRMVVHGGGDFGAYENDSWLLESGPAPRRQAWLIASSVGDHSATLLWQATDAGPAAVVERSSIGESWCRVGTAPSDALLRYRFQDGGLAAGWPYRYRLRAASSGALMSAETGITTSGPPPLRILGAWPNPAPAGPLVLHVALGSAHPATVELFDLQGRRAGIERLSPRGAGLTSVRPSGAWGPGIYLVRLMQDGRSVTGKVCVLKQPR
jgi:galactose oxidase-like protein